MSKVVEVEIKDNCGLHAKKCMNICKIAQNFKSTMSLAHKGYEIDLKSILGLMSLCVSSGEKVKLSISGEDSEAAVNALLPILQ